MPPRNHSPPKKKPKKEYINEINKPKPVIHINIDSSLAHYDNRNTSSRMYSFPSLMFKVILQMKKRVTPYQDQNHEVLEMLQGGIEETMFLMQRMQDRHNFHH